MSKARTIGSGKLRRAKNRPPIEQFPEPHPGNWEDPGTFGEALDLHMRRHRDSDASLRRAIVAEGDRCDRTTIRSWRSGAKEPRSVASYELLHRIEDRYRLRPGYFREKLSNSVRATIGLDVPGVRRSERRRLAWHLPDDFDRRTAAEQQEILRWVRQVIVSGATEYRQFQAAALRDRYGLRFPHSHRDLAEARLGGEEGHEADPDPELVAGPLSAPPALQAELAALVRFKTTTLTEIGFCRRGVWGEETAAQKTEHLGLLFGALSASPSSRVDVTPASHPAGTGIRSS